MKRLSVDLWISLSIILMSLNSCNVASPTESPSLEPLINVVNNTATPISPTEGPSLAPTLVSVTETPSFPSTSVPGAEIASLTLTPIPLTETPTFIPPAAQTQDIFKTRIEVRLPNLAGQFFLRPDTDLTITDIGSDGNVNNCTISQRGRTVVTRLVPIGRASNSYRLPRGDYKMNCGIPLADATIKSGRR